MALPRLTSCFAALRQAVLEEHGYAPTNLRQRVCAFAQGTGKLDDVPPAVRKYVELVRLHAYRVTDEDVAALKADGLTDDDIFEITAAAALGAGMLRLEKGLALLEEKP